MPPKKGGGTAVKKRNQSLDINSRPSSMTHGASHASKNSLAAKSSQPKFNIAPLVLEGVKINKVQLNDMLKKHLDDVTIHDIQLSRAGIFTLYASDVNSFNRVLNEFAAILAANGQPSAKIYVPRSIQRIKDTETVAFIKRVDLELPVDRITEALKHVGLDVTDVIRLGSRDGNTPTRTIKITFKDASNRNTFVHTGLQVDSMHFVAEAASQNTKPVQCYICMKYNHVAKYCKTKQQVCSRCGEDHRMDQCTVANDAVKCCNCKGNHLATSNDCSHHKEQETRMRNLVNQYSSASKPILPAPSPHNTNEYPSLPNTTYQLQMEQRQNDFFDNLLNVLTSKMEAIIEETTNRLFNSLQQKMKKIEKAIASVENLVNASDYTSDSDTDSDQDIMIVKGTSNKQQQQTTTTKKQTSKATATATAAKPKPPTSTSSTTTTSTSSTQPSIPNNDSSKKQSSKPKTAITTTAQPFKRPHSPNSSLDSTTTDIKDLKTNGNDD